MKSSDVYRILRDRFSDEMKRLGWFRGRGGVPNWFIPFGDEYALCWFQAGTRPGWNDYWGSEFTMEFQVAEYAEWGYGGVDRRRRFGELLGQKDLDEIRTRQNEIIRSLVRPPTDYKFLSGVPSEDEWLWERFEVISEPYSSEHDIWLRYHSSEDVDRWGAFLLDRFPGMWNQFTILLKEEANPSRQGWPAHPL